MQSIAPAELGDRKAGLVSDMQSCKQLKVKKTRNVQACSLFSLSSLFSGKGKKKLIPLFLLPFHYYLRIMLLKNNAT